MPLGARPGSSHRCPTRSPAETSSTAVPVSPWEPCSSRATCWEGRGTRRPPTDSTSRSSEWAVRAPKRAGVRDRAYRRDLRRGLRSRPPAGAGKDDRRRRQPPREGLSLARPILPGATVHGFPRTPGPGGRPRRSPRRDARPPPRAHRQGGDGGGQARLCRKAADLHGPRGARACRDRGADGRGHADGKSGHSGDDARLVNEWVEAGVIGDVREVHIWTNRPIWPQGIHRRSGGRRD